MTGKISIRLMLRVKVRVRVKLRVVVIHIGSLPYSVGIHS